MREALEDGIQLVERDSDAGIGHRESEQTRLTRAGFVFDPQRDFATFGELDGVADQVQKNLPQAHDVPRQAGGDFGREIVNKRQAFLVCAQVHEAHRALENLREVEVRLLQNQLIRLHLGEIQDVVDEQQQAVPGLLEDLGIRALVGSQWRLLQEIGHADDRIQRCSDLVTHAGEKVRLGLARGLGHGLGLLQFGLDPLTLRDVARRREDALQRTVPVVKGGRVIGHHRLLPIAGARRQLVVGDLLFPQHELDPRLGPLRIGEVALEWRADQFIAGAAGERLHLLVDVRDDAGGIGGHQRVDVGFDQRARVDHLTCGVIGANQEIADDGVLGVPQRRH